MNDIEVDLHCEMFGLLDANVTDETAISESLMQLLRDTYDFQDERAEILADQFVRNNYDDIAQEVEECQEDATDTYDDKWRDYREMVGV